MIICPVCCSEFEFYDTLLGEKVKCNCGHSWILTLEHVFLKDSLIMAYLTHCNSKSYIYAEDTEVIKKAFCVIVNEQKATTSLLQRQLTIGYNQASEILSEFEKRGIVSSTVSGGIKREVLLNKEDFLIHLLNLNRNFDNIQNDASSDTQSIVAATQTSKIKIHCPKCSNVYKYTSDLLGCTVQCKCGYKWMLPATENAIEKLEIKIHRRKTNPKHPSWLNYVNDGKTSKETINNQHNNILVQCPDCKKQYEITDSLVGTKIECVCGKKLIVECPIQQLTIIKHNSPANEKRKKENEKKKHEPNFFATCLNDLFEFILTFDITSFLKKILNLLLVILFLAGGIWAYRSCSASVEEAKLREYKYGSRIDAQIFIENKILSILKAPATAKITFTKKPNATAIQFYEFEGYYDAQNSFGVFLRSYFKISLKYENGRYVPTKVEVTK